MSRSKLFSAALSLLALTLQLSATTIVHKSFDELVKESDGIVSGRVAAVESQYSPSKEIYTFVTLDRVEVLAGSYQSSTLTIRLKGGQVGNNISQIVGSPEFNVDDQVVLFIEGNGRYMVPLVGWTQGMFRLVQDPASGLQVVHDHEGNRVLGVKAGQVVKEELVKPAADIVGQAKAFGVTGTRNEASAGTSDATPAVNLAQAQIATSRSPSPTMTSTSFVGAIKTSAAASKTAVRQLNNVSVLDFSVPGNHTDSFVGSKAPAALTPQSTAPALPARKPQAPAVKEQ